VVRRLVPLAGDHANAQAVRSESQAPWRQGLVAAPWPSRDQTPAAVGQLFDGHRRPRRRVPLWALLAGAVLVGALADAAGVLLARGALSSEPPASAAAPACVCPVDAGDPEK
jgi:hypothetical protein